MKVFLLFAMLFMHIVDDYYLQGILASLKQKSWWQEYAPQDLYKHDYIVALFMHAFSWSFMTILPIAVYMFINGSNEYLWFVYVFYIIYNTICHAGIDHLKANKKQINLICDQLLHVGQILITYITFILFYEINI